jgi:hypothetical protein
MLSVCDKLNPVGPPFFLVIGFLLATISSMCLRY